MKPSRAILVVALLSLASPAGAEPELSHEGGYLAYTSDGSIFVSSPDGSSRRRLTTSEGDQSPAWSPSGEQIAFLRNHDGGMDLYVVGAGGRGEKRLAEDVGESYDWSPDGAQIVYSSAATRGLLTQTPHIFVVHVASGVVEQMTEGDRADVQPEWSPDGGSIAFVGSVDEGVGISERSKADIFRLHLRSGRLIALTRSAGANYSPQWSPDGRRIVFASTRDDRGASMEPAQEVYVMRGDGSRERRLTHRIKQHDVAPTWSPDGRRIAFVSYRGAAAEGAGTLRVVRPDGRGDRALTRADRLMPWDPSWSSRGRSIVFVASVIGANGDRSDTEIARVELGRDGVELLTDNPRFEWGPDWL